MGRLWRTFASFYRRNRLYFSNNQHQVAEDNLRMLWAALRILLAFLLVYGVWTTVTLCYSFLAACYGVTCALVLALLLVTAFFRRRMPAPWMVQAACAAFVCILMGFIIVISVFPFPHDPAIFYPVGYIIVASLFHFSYQRITLLMTGISVAYWAVVNMFRPAEMAYFDHFAAVTTWIATTLFLLLLSDLRLRNGEAMLLLEKVSRTDTLTGLPNRRGAQMYMPPSFRRCQQKGLPVAAMMIDVDYFKEYNDTLGHQAGDACLQAISQVLRIFAEEYGVLVSRYGGEEFLLLLPDVSEPEARRLSEELLDRVRRRALEAPRGIVTISMGVAIQQPGPADTIQDLICQADEALYRAKTSGRDRATIATRLPSGEKQAAAESGVE